MKIFILSILFFTTHILYSQTILTGTVTSSLTNEGLPYANLSLAGTTLGTTTNIEGAFTLTIPEQNVTAGTLVVSSLGFTTERIAVPLALQQQDGIIKLTPAAVLLQAVEVRAEKQTIVEAAVAAIPANYDNGSMIMKVFTRALSKREDYPIQASEAAFDIYRGSIDRNPKRTIRQLRIQRGRISRDSVSFRNIYQVNIGLTPTDLYRLDVVREAKMLHDKKERDKHVFTLRGVVRYNDRPAYKIEFDQRDSLKEACYAGVMYIDTASLAFMHIERGWSKKGLPYLTETFENRAAAKILGLHKSRWNYRDMTFDYAVHNGKWHLQHVTMKGSFQLIREKGGLNTALVMDDLFLITEVLTDNVAPFPDKEVARQRQHIERQFEAYDPEFWKGYTYQLPDPGFKELFEDIRRRNEASRPAPEVSTNRRKRGRQ